MTTARGEEIGGEGTAEGVGGLKRVLGPIDATCVVVGAIIGVGIFFTPSQVAEIAGSGRVALLAWAVGGAIALAGALTFAELGGLYPRTGGQYEILRDAYGPLPGFLYVFCNATAIQAGAIAIIAMVCSKHLAGALGKEITGTVHLISISSILIVGLTMANAAGVRWGARIQNLTVLAKVATLLVVTLLAASAEPAAFETAAEATEGGAESPGLVRLIFMALVPAFFAFGGWQHALWIAGEVRQPRRNVPLSIVGGVMVVVIVYLLVNWAYLRLLGYEGVTGSTSLAADAVARVWPGTGRQIVAAAVAISAFGVLNAQLLAGPRLIHGMALDGRFFSLFARVSARFGTPLPAILLLGSTSIALLVAALAAKEQQALGLLLTGVVFIDGVFFAMTGCALIILRRKRPDADRPVRVPGYPFVPLLFVLGEVGIVLGAYLEPEARKAAIIGAVWIVVAAVFFFAFFRDGSRRKESGIRE
ncbi:MAG: amino acid permease [Planctomycetes bacterium]|nr:amino acid permease [Planctomycetota bacterium]